MAHKVTPTVATHNGRVNVSQPVEFLQTNPYTRAQPPGLGTACALISGMSTKPLAHQVVPGVEGAESAAAEDGAVRPRDSLFHWCGTVDALRQPTNNADRQSLLDAYFTEVAEETIAPAARFFRGIIQDSDPSAPPVPREVVIDAMRDLARMEPDDLRERCRTETDLGCVAEEVFAGRLPSGLAMSEVAAWGEELARARTPSAQRLLVRDMLTRLNGLEARYLVNLITGDLALDVDPAELDEAMARRKAVRAG
jgi:hypothetical protein